MSEMDEFDRLNHKAYLDVLVANEPDPILKNNETYMKCYRGWENLVSETHYNTNNED